MESIHRIVSIVAATGIVQGLFLSFALLRKGGATRRSDRRLASLLLLFSAAIAIPEFGFPEGAAPLHLNLLVIGAFLLALGPLLLAYARALRSEIGGAGLYPSRKPRPGDAAHAIPLAAYLAVLFFLSKASRSEPPAAAASEAALKIAFAAVIAHAVAYLAVVLRSLHDLTRRLKTRFSDVKSLDLSWLRFFSIALIAACSIIAAYAISASGGHLSDPGDKTSSLALALLIYALGWRGLFQKAGPGSPPRRPEPPEPPSRAEPAERSAKYARSGVRPSEAESLLGGLRKLMEEEKPYLDPELTLGALASEAGMSAGDVSRIINEAGGTNFYDFVNGYRVEEAKRLLADEAQRDRSVLDIAYGAGFRSKSTFNDSFKRLTGKTPGEFRRASPPA